MFRVCSKNATLAGLDQRREVIGIGVQIIAVPGLAGSTMPATIMRDAHYRGYIVLEYEEAGDVREECAKHLAEIRTAFA